MGPGATALTRMFLLTSWLDSARVNAICTGQGGSWKGRKEHFSRC
jgi:hypothetical protein